MKSPVLILGFSDDESIWSYRDHMTLGMKFPADTHLRLTNSPEWTVVSGKAERRYGGTSTGNKPICDCFEYKKCR